MIPPAISRPGRTENYSIAIAIWHRPFGVDNVNLPHQARQLLALEMGNWTLTAANRVLSALNDAGVAVVRAVTLS